MSNQDVTEDEVISIFLKAEVDSSRFGPTILHLLRERGLERKIIDQPNLHDKKENLSRADILGVYRGYGRNQFLFAKFPRNVNWQRIQCDQASLEQIRYVDCTPWRELSGGTLRIADAAERIRNGLEDSATTGTIISTIREIGRAHV